MKKYEYINTDNRNKFDKEGQLVEKGSGSGDGGIGVDDIPTASLSTRGLVRVAPATSEQTETVGIKNGLLYTKVIKDYAADIDSINTTIDEIAALLVDMDDAIGGNSIELTKLTGEIVILKERLNLLASDVSNIESQLDGINFDDYALNDDLDALDTKYINITNNLKSGLESITGTTRTILTDISNIKFENIIQNNRLMALENIDSSSFVSNDEFEAFKVSSKTYVDNKVTIVNAALDDLQTQIDGIESGGADLTNYYTKDETNALDAAILAESVAADAVVKNYIDNNFYDKTVLDDFLEKVDTGALGKFRFIEDRLGTLLTPSDTFVTVSDIIDLLDTYECDVLQCYALEADFDIFDTGASYFKWFEGLISFSRVSTGVLIEYFSGDASSKLCGQLLQETGQIDFKDAQNHSGLLSVGYSGFSDILNPHFPEGGLYVGSSTKVDNLPEGHDGYGTGSVVKRGNDITLMLTDRLGNQFLNTYAQLGSEPIAWQGWKQYAFAEDIGGGGDVDLSGLVKTESSNLTGSKTAELLNESGDITANVVGGKISFETDDSNYNSIVLKIGSNQVMVDYAGRAYLGGIEYDELGMPIGGAEIKIETQDHDITFTYYHEGSLRYIDINDIYNSIHP